MPAIRNRPFLLYPDPLTRLPKNNVGQRHNTGNASRLETRPLARPDGTVTSFATLNTTDSVGNKFSRVNTLLFAPGPTAPLGANDVHQRRPIAKTKVKCLQVRDTRLDTARPASASSVAVRLFFPVEVDHGRPITQFTPFESPPH